MNFADNEQEASFRQEARNWLHANRPIALAPQLAELGFAPNELREADLLVESRKWQALKASDGWACIHWPKEYGGRAATPIERVIWKQEEGIYANLSHLFFIGQNMCGPTLIEHATEEQKRRYLPKIASGEEIWCQLFSEPSAGSDLAAVQTRAVRDDDAWVVNGQKVWTSGAHFSQFGLLLARTDTAVAKHKGLTMFFLDMASPGVEIRPIQQADGGAEFNEVYFNDVRIPDSQRLGGSGDGWNVALGTLMNERLSHGTGMPTGFPEVMDLACMPRTDGSRPIDDPATRARLASLAWRDSALRLTGLRLVGGLKRGEVPGPESSIGKLVAGPMMQEVAMLAIDLQGAAGIVSEYSHAQAAARFQTMLLRSAATRIEGGTDEILRNILAERVLNLPPEPRLDKVAKAIG